MSTEMILNAEIKPEIIKEYMTVLRPCLHFHGIQIKSLKIFKEFCKYLDELEILVGIHSCTISLEDIFVCPDIKFPNVSEMTSMEELVYELILDLDKQRGKNEENIQEKDDGEDTRC